MLSSLLTNRSASALLTTRKLTKSLLVNNAEQYRSMSVFTNFQKTRRLEQLKQQMDKAPSDGTTLAYLQQVAQLEPMKALQYLENGWMSGKIPTTEPFLKTYIKSAAAINKLDAINLTAVLGMIDKTHVSADAAGRGSGSITAAEIEAIVRRVGMANSAAPALAVGSASDPLYVRSAETTGKAFLQKFALQAMAVFIVCAFVGTFIIGDEKTGGGIANRLGMGSIVKQAEKSDKTFADVVGIDEAKGDLQEIVMYLKDPKRFTRLGGRLPKGVLLTGPPGTGKTLLARAIAGEAGVPFFHTSGSEFEEMYVGVGAKRVRELFEAAKAKSPCIIFIDEIDAIGGSRQVKDQSAMKMTLNQLLVEMDGFQQNTGIIVIAATNFPDSLDAALIRPGRLDKHVDVPLPDIGGRQAILELYGTKVPLDPDVSMEQLARGTPGFSGAELFNLVNQAALKASVEGLQRVGMGALEYAKDKIMMGAERRSAVISPETLRMTAFHEAGHALVALKTEGSDPIHKATIMPRGRSLGMVMQLPDGDQTSMSRKQMMARLDICMGGRVAEELVYGEQNVTSGASSDIQQATRLAKAMVTKYGFSDKVGVVFIDEQNGKQSGATMQFIDDEVRDLLTGSYARAKALLEQHRKELENIAQGLMEYESLSGHEIVEIAAGRTPNLAKRSQKPSRATQVLPGVRPTVAPGSTGSGNCQQPPSGGIKVSPPIVAATPAPTPKTEAPTAPRGSIFSAIMGGNKQPAAAATTAAVDATSKQQPAAASSAQTLTPPSPKTASNSANKQQQPQQSSVDSTASLSSAPAPAAGTVTRGPPKA